MDYAQSITVVALNIFLSIFGTLGNTLIIVAVLNTAQLRQKPSNILLLSLAVADLVVTTIAQPLFSASLAQKVLAGQCNQILEKIYIVGAPFSACSSALHLAAISIDRALATVKPHQHREIMKKWSKVMVFVCWSVATLYGCMLLPVPPVKSALQITLVLCFVIMIVSYGTILWKLKTSNITPAMSTSNARERAMERKVSGTIGIVIILFAICWFPFIGFNLAKPKATLFCSFDNKLIWIRSLVLSNSSMNFIVYTLRIGQFRKAFSKIINKILCRPVGAKLCCCLSAPKDTTVQPVSTYASTLSATR